MRLICEHVECQGSHTAWGEAAARRKPTCPSQPKPAGFTAPLLINTLGLPIIKGTLLPAAVLPPLATLPLAILSLVNAVGMGTALPTPFGIAVKAKFDAFRHRLAPPQLGEEAPTAGRPGNQGRGLCLGCPGENGDAEPSRMRLAAHWPGIGASGLA